jgi:hypothetical protein
LFYSAAWHKLSEKIFHSVLKFQSTDENTSSFQIKQYNIKDGNWKAWGLGQYTSLTPSLFTKVPVPKVGGPVFVCRSIDFASFCDCSIGFWNCSDGVVFFLNDFHCTIEGITYTSFSYILTTIFRVRVMVFNATFNNI